MKTIVAIVSLISVLAPAQSVYETGAEVTPPNDVDARVLTLLQERGIEPALLCSDEVFVRRVCLDVIGTLPTGEEAAAFLDDDSPGKRAALIDRLLERPEFAEYWGLKWGDLLRVKSEFPINLWPNAAQAYDRWIRDALRQNIPYDQFARALLTSSGSNFRVPPVNFYRAVQGREPATIAEAVALTFMGVRLGAWPEERRVGMAAFFSRIAYKQTGEWKEEIVCLDPAPVGPLQAQFPDGTVVQISADQDPRQVFAEWLLAPENPWFARNIVNRIWTWLFGRGIIHEPDDIREDNPPVDPELLGLLEEALRDAHYDLRQIYRLILNSRTYQQSCVPRSEHPDAAALFAHYSVRRVDAEVLIDALDGLLGSEEEYSSPIPEPFTYLPEHQRTVALGDGSITSPFLEMFGRPARDTGLESERNNEPSDAQSLYLLNSSQVQRKIEDSRRLRELLRSTRRNPPAAVRTIYLHLLSRYPTMEELGAVRDYARANALPPLQTVQDLVWALINSKEFLYRH